MTRLASTERYIDRVIDQLKAIESAPGWVDPKEAGDMVKEARLLIEYLR